MRCILLSTDDHACSGGISLVVTCAVGGRFVVVDFRELECGVEALQGKQHEQGWVILHLLGRRGREREA